jgi:hypothetical protein
MSVAGMVERARMRTCVRLPRKVWVLQIRSECDRTTSLGAICLKK